jgi:hypothetical protein
MTFLRTYLRTCSNPKGEYSKYKRIVWLGIEIQGYQRDQQVEQAEKRELSEHHTYLQLWWQGPEGL